MQWFCFESCWISFSGYRNMDGIIYILQIRKLWLDRESFIFLYSGDLKLWRPYIDLLMKDVTGELMPNFGATYVAPAQRDQHLFSSKRRPHFKKKQRSWNEQKRGHGFRWGPEPKMTVLTKTSNKFLLRSDLTQLNSMYAKFTIFVSVIKDHILISVRELERKSKFSQCGNNAGFLQRT
jgi:hypothetical protein